MVTSLPARPRLKRSIEVFAAPDGRIYLLRGGAHPDLAVERSPANERLLGLLDGGRGADELPALVAAGGAVSPADVRVALKQLQGAGVLEDAADDGALPGGVARRLERQLRYFGDIGGAVAPSAAQARLSGASVLMLGLGGLGSWATLALAACGVGRIVGVDGDRVELSNLNRQVLYGEADVGRLKAEAAREAVGAFHSGVRFDAVPRMMGSRADLEALDADVDVVVHTADWPPHHIERWAAEVWFPRGVPIMSMSQVAPLVRVGPFYVPGVTGCYGCQELRHRREFAHFDALVEYRQGQPSPASSFGPGCALVGSLVAADVVHHLTGLAPPATTGRALVVDLRTFQTDRRPEVLADPDCETCGRRG